MSKLSLEKPLLEHFIELIFFFLRCVIVCFIPLGVIIIFTVLGTYFIGPIDTTIIPFNF